MTSEPSAAAGIVAPPLEPSLSLLVLTACAAGSVDALSYLGLGHVLTANMTGNTVLLGLALGQVQGLASLRSLLALVCFALGAVASALRVEPAREAGAVRKAIRSALLAEGLMLALVAVLWFRADAKPDDAGIYGLIVLTAFAMGIQSAAMRRFGAAGIVTTYITGTLTSLCVGMVAKLRHAVASSPETAPGRHRIRWHVAVLVTYGLGALATGFIETHAPLWSAAIPAVAIAIAIVRRGV